MTELEKQIASRLQQCSFLPGSFDKQFSFQLRNWIQKDLTQKGRDMMLHLFHKYRRQIPDYLNLKAQLDNLNKTTESQNT